MRVRVYDPAGRVETDRRERDAAVRIDYLTEADDLVNTDDLADADDRSVFVAVGEAALFEYVRRGGTGPVLPIGVDAGIPSVPERAATEGLAALSDDHDTITYPTLDVTASETRYRALTDVMVVTAEPARISEYRTRKVRTDTVIDQVRADGIVVSGPAGTPGYGTAAGGPIGLIEDGDHVTRLLASSLDLSLAADDTVSFSLDGEMSDFDSLSLSTRHRALRVPVGEDYDPTPTVD